MVHTSPCALCVEEGTQVRVHSFVDRRMSLARLTPDHASVPPCVLSPSRRSFLLCGSVLVRLILSAWRRLFRRAQLSPFFSGASQGVIAVPVAHLSRNSVHSFYV